MVSTYTWTLESGTVPPGLSLSLADTDLDITLTGTPTTPGVYTFTVRITNDISSDFDDKQFQVTIIDPAIQITPDVGGSVRDMFDSAQNPLLATVDTTDLTLDASLSAFQKYVTMRKIPVSIDIGAGVNIYWFNLGDIKPGLPVNTWYLWRITSDPTNIKRVFII